MRVYTPLSLSILIFAFIPNAWALQCTPLDLGSPSYLQSKGKPELIGHYQSPRDQDGVGWCGGFAAADALSHALGKPVSAIDVSLQYFAETSPKKRIADQSGLAIVDAMKTAVKEGYCPESRIPSDQTSSSNLGFYALQSLTATLQAISDAYKENGKDAALVAECSTRAETPLSSFLPSISPDTIRDVLLKTDGESTMMTKELMMALCGSARTKISLDAKTYYSSDKPRFPQILIEAMDKDILPVFDMEASDFSILGPSAGPHAMTVVARRPTADGRCEFQIRNSWGRSCYSYNDHFRQSCDEAQGGFWMTEDEIKKYVMDVYVLEKVGPPEAPRKSEPSYPWAEGNGGYNQGADSGNSKGPDLIGWLKRLFGGTPDTDKSQEDAKISVDDKLVKQEEHKDPPGRIVYNPDNGTGTDAEKSEEKPKEGNFFTRLWGAISSLFKW